MENSNTYYERQKEYFSSPYNVLCYTTIQYLLTNEIEKENNNMTPYDLNYNIKKIDYQTFIDKMNDQTYCCPITLEEFNKHTIIAETPCNHYFTYDSIILWLQNKSNKCPCCRNEITSCEKNIFKNLFNMQQMIID